MINLEWLVDVGNEVGVTRHSPVCCITCYKTYVAQSSDHFYALHIHFIMMVIIMYFIRLSTIDCWPQFWVEYFFYCIKDVHVSGQLYFLHENCHFAGMTRTIECIPFEWYM